NRGRNLQWPAKSRRPGWNTGSPRSLSPFQTVPARSYRISSAEVVEGTLVAGPGRPAAPCCPRRRDSQPWTSPWLSRTPGPSYAAAFVVDDLGVAHLILLGEHASQDVLPEWVQLRGQLARLPRLLSDPEQATNRLAVAPGQPCDLTDVLAPDP